METDIRNMPEGFGNLEYQNITNIHPLALLAVIILGITLLMVSRRWTLFPILIIACFVSSVQKISVFNLDFNVLRIMVCCGITRLILREEYLDFVWKPLDKVIVLLVISSTVVYTLQQATFDAFVNRLGFAFDALGIYFLFRCMIRDWFDLDRIVLSFILISIPVAVFFLIENRTGHNLFAFFGGVPEITVVRQGRLRCQGAFSHPIIAGCFWASLIPLITAFWWKSTHGKVWAVTGLLTSITIVICCASSTPAMGVIAAMIGGVFFCLRFYMRFIRWGILLNLIALHMVMEAPVWHLIGRATLIGGSASYFRYMIINEAITHFHEWAILGTKSTAHWFWGAQDLTNQYVLTGVEGGLLTLCLFVALIVIAFREVGRLWRLQIGNPYRLALAWTLGVSLFVHCIEFLGISYFGQSVLVWYLLLAIIGSLSVKEGTVRMQKIRSSSATLISRHP